MREYKFRGKTLDGNEWCYGYLVVKPDKQTLIEQCDELRRVSPQYVVDPETVGEYTGLKDAKGKEIYEGDILLYRLPENMIALNNSDKSVVFYEQGMFWVSHGKIGFSVEHVLGVHGDDAVVIGNVHDNPEILEAKA